MDKMSEHILEYARVIEMCKGTPLEDTPWKGAMFGSDRDWFPNHPYLQGHDASYISYAVAILEGKPVFVGDVIYPKQPGQHTWVSIEPKLEYVTPKMFGGSARVAMEAGGPVLVFTEGTVEKLSLFKFAGLDECFTWTPPQEQEKPRTFTLNGTEVPCPLQERGPSRLTISVESSHERNNKVTSYFHFDNPEEVQDIYDALTAILNEAKQK